MKKKKQKNNNPPGIIGILPTVPSLTRFHAFLCMVHR